MISKIFMAVMALFFLLSAVAFAETAPKEEQKEDGTSAVPVPTPSLDLEVYKVHEGEKSNTFFYKRGFIEIQNKENTGPNLFFGSSKGCSPEGGEKYSGIALCLKW